MSSTTKYFVVAELHKSEMHGYELMARLEKIMGKKPSPSQIYPVLKQMKALGYLNVSVRMDGRRKIKYYSLTSSGKKLFKTMAKRFDILIRSALEERIKVCAHCGCEMLSGAVSRKKGGSVLYFCCSSCAASYKG